MNVVTAQALGANSEVGNLHTVMVHRPDLAHERLSPTNCHDLLFDDVIWVQNARRDHFDFVSKMRERGVEVVELHNLLTETLAIGEAKKWLLDRKIIANEVGLGLVDDEVMAVVGGNDHGGVVPVGVLLDPRNNRLDGIFAAEDGADRELPRRAW